MNATATMLCDVDAINPCVGQSTPPGWGRDLFEASPGHRAALAEVRIGQVLSYQFVHGILQYQVHRFCVIGRLKTIGISEPVLMFEVFRVNGGECFLTIEILPRNGAMLLDGEAVGWARTHEDVQDLIVRAFRSTRR